MAALKVGVLGGTFDPVHLGHLILAEHAREELGLARVLWVPAGDPWRKRGHGVTPAADRMAMVRLAIGGQRAFAVSAVEVERPGPSYTAETLAALHTDEPEAELVLLLGQDALEDLPAWREPERILELATVAVARRGEGEAAAEQALAGPPGRLVWLTMPRIDISATELRRRAAAGLSLRYLVPDAVAAYIHQHRLYKDAG